MQQHLSINIIQMSVAVRPRWRRRSGEEKRVLILDQDANRGWEASHVLAVALDGNGLENLVMRTAGYCALVKEVNIISDIDSN